MWTIKCRNYQKLSKLSHKTVILTIFECGRDICLTVSSIYSLCNSFDSDKSIFGSDRMRSRTQIRKYIQIFVKQD